MSRGWIHFEPVRTQDTSEWEDAKNVRDIAGIPPCFQCHSIWMGQGPKWIKSLRCSSFGPKPQLVPSHCAAFIYLASSECTLPRFCGVDNGITQRTSEELLWAWSPSVMFCGHVLVIIPRHVDRRPPARCLSPSHKSEFHGHLLGREMCYAGWQGVLVASTKLTYPTLGKGKSSSKLTFWRGYVSSQEGSFWCLIF